MNVRVLAEFECWPIWMTTPTQPDDNVDPQDLPISRELADELTSWDEEFQAIYDRDVPQDSDFPSDQKRAEWLERGEALARRLHEELGPDVEVTYRGSGGGVRLHLPPRG